MADTIRAATEKMGEAVKNHIPHGRNTAAEREPMETLLDTATTRMKTDNAPRHAAGESTRKQPAAVATPFPPFLRPV